MEKNNLNIGIIGCGTVGEAVIVALLEEQKFYQAKFKTSITIAKIAVKNLAKARASVKNKSLLTDNAFEIVENKSIDLVVELMGGVEMVYDLAKLAINNKKHFITANKALISTHGDELISLAQKNEVFLKFEAAVGGGIPILETIRNSLVGEEIKSIVGIINGTTNYIFSQMEKGFSFEQALADAQGKGYAEVDPSFDIDGVDAAHKITILSALGFGTKFQLDKIEIEGVTKIKSEHIRLAKLLGYSIKHLGVTEKISDNQISLKVHPTLIPKNNILSQVSGVMNAVLVDSNKLGTSLYYGAGAGANTTASAVVADILSTLYSLENNFTSNLQSIFGWRQVNPEIKIIPQNQLESTFFLYMIVDDKPSVLAKISEFFAQNQISIEKINQEPADDNPELAVLAITTNKVIEDKLALTKKKLSESDFIKSDIIHIRILSL